jgi:hypothetical protein
MAIPIRSIPVLEGAAARRFEREARKAEKERGTIKISKEDWEFYERQMKEYKKNIQESSHAKIS